MKIKIEYEYDENGYFASYRDEEGIKRYFNSIDSFEIAKQKLVAYVKSKSDVQIPETEEIEI
jgi:hypothetical protein